MNRDKDRPGRSDQHNSRGIELADRGWLDEAIREFAEVVRLQPQSEAARKNLAAARELAQKR